MKKVSFLAAAVLASASLMSSHAHAQGLRLGIKAGANLSNLSGNLDQKDRFTNKVGFHGGLLLNADVTGDGFFSIQPELLYSQKGYKNADYQYNVGGATYKYKGNVNYNYLDLPILAKINAGGIFFEAGPQLSYLLSVKDKTELTSSSQNAPLYSTSNAENLSNVNRFEVGYAAGLGYQVESGPMIGIRYNGAFTDFSKDGYNNNRLKNARNSVFQAYVGFLVGGK